MPTLSDLRTQVSRDLRDTANTTWSTAQVDDLVNQGIDAVADVYPREIVSTLGTVAASVFSYAASSFSTIFRIDIYSSASSYKGQIQSGIGDGRNSGYEVHGGVVYVPVSWSWTTGDTLQAWGYGRYTQLAAATATTDLDATGIWAMRVFAMAEGFSRLLADRAAFLQWQTASGNTDVTVSALTQLTLAQRQRWRDEQRRLRRMRKLG